MNERKVVLIKQTKGGAATQECHTRASIVTEVANHGACGFITPIDMDKRVFLHNTHVIDRTSIQLTVGTMFVYAEQMDSSDKKVAVNFKRFIKPKIVLYFPRFSLSIL